MAFTSLGSQGAHNPDFFRCDMDEFGGSGVIVRQLLPDDCVRAGEKLAANASMISFKVAQNPWNVGEVENMITSFNEPYSLPWEATDGKPTLPPISFSSASTKELNFSLLAI